jgi:hypothetical protein
MEDYLVRRLIVSFKALEQLEGERPGTAKEFSDLVRNLTEIVERAFGHTLDLLKPISVEPHLPDEETRKNLHGQLSSASEYQYIHQVLNISASLKGLRKAFNARLEALGRKYPDRPLEGLFNGINEGEHGVIESIDELVGSTRDAIAAARTDEAWQAMRQEAQQLVKRLETNLLELREHAETLIHLAETTTDAGTAWQRISKLHAATAMGGSILALLVGWYLIEKLPELTRGNVVPQAYYVLLVFLAAGAAAAVFGIVGSVAKLTGRLSGIAFQFGGPAAIFVFVLVAGFFLPPKADTLDLIFRLSGPDQVREIARGATIEVSFGRRSSTLPFGESGEAFWPGIPDTVRSQGVRVRFFSDSYAAKRADDKYEVGSDGTVLVEVDRKPSGK